MSGQGADEIFLGYRKYLGFYLQSLLRRGRYLAAARVLGGFAINRTVVNQFDLADAKRYCAATGANRKRVWTVRGFGGGFRRFWGWAQVRSRIGKCRRHTAFFRTFAVPL